MIVSGTTRTVKGDKRKPGRTARKSPTAQLKDLEAYQDQEALNDSEQSPLVSNDDEPPPDLKLKQAKTIRKGKEPVYRVQKITARSQMLERKRIQKLKAQAEAKQPPKRERRRAWWAVTLDQIQMNKEIVKNQTYSKSVREEFPY